VIVEQPPAGASSTFGRIDADGTVYVRTNDGERIVGSWLAGSPDDGLAYYGRKYDDLAAEVAILENRVATDPDRAAHSARRLRGELGTAAVVGDLAALEGRVDAILEAAAARKNEVSEQRAAARAEAIAVKEALVGEAEKLAESNEWRHADEQIRQIVERWKALGRLDRKTDDTLWTRIAAARSTVQRRRRAHFAELDEKRKAAQARKSELVVEAEKLASSTSWGPTTVRFRELMTEWKAAGGAPKGTEAELWGRFRAAQDAFFAARTAARAERDAGVKEAVAGREALLTEAESLDPKSDGVRKRLRDIQRRWDASGSLPRDAAAVLDRRLAAVEEGVRDAEQARRKPDVSDNPLVVRLNESIAKLERRIERARRDDDQRTLGEAEAALETQRGWLAQATRGS
jgi:hypothetical protein